MSRPIWMAIALLALGSPSLTSCAREAPSAVSPVEPAMPEVRNPFGLERDVDDCVGPDVEEFDAAAPLLGKPDDPNAEPWARVGDETEFETIDGEWASRWKQGDGEWTAGTATVRSEGDRVFIHYRDENVYLVEAVRRGERLVGRYNNLSGDRLDTSPWVAEIVDFERIDGAWVLGRWDLRRGAQAVE